MSFTTGDLCPNKYLLVWPMPIPNEVRALFTMIFNDIFGLFKYTCKVLTKTDTFHLIIPLDCLGHLLKDPVFRFRQVVHIDVICDSINDLKQIEPWFKFGFEKLKFCTINNVLNLWEKTLLHTALASSSSTNQIIKSAIISLIQARVSAKRSDKFNYRSQIVKQFPNLILHGFPVKNVNDFTQDYICPSCKLFYRIRCQLNCGHYQCKVCVNIHTSCAKCSRDILRDKVIENTNLQIAMQNVQIYCSHCDYIPLFKDYEVHLKQSHSELITHFLCNEEADENTMSISLNGTCIWEISDIEKLKNNATNGEHKSFYSSPFYLFPNGYKMCLRLYINGDSKARNTHMSLFFVIMRGKYDDKLEWPFKFKATFSLIDQSSSISNENQKHHIKICCPNLKEKCFERPIRDMNDGFGIPMFIPLDLFQQNPNRYIKNDTMYIKIEFDLLTEKINELIINGEGELPNDDEHVNTINYQISDLICCSDECKDVPQS